MADVLLSALLPVVMEKAADYVLQQFGAMWGIQGHLEKLKRTLAAVQRVLDDAEERQVNHVDVKIWLEALKDAAYEADDILDEFATEAIRRRVEIQADMTKKVRSFFSFHNPVWFRVKMGRKLKDIVEKIDGIAAERDNFDFTVTTQPQNRETHSYVVETEVIGRENDKEKLVKLLLDNVDDQNVAVLPIVGMGGLGKTTLAQLIYQDERVKKHFQLLIWVCVSDEFDVAKIAQRMIDLTTGKKCDPSNMELLQRHLREALSGKRYFLVLDDIWNEDQARWDELKTLLGTGGEGSKIIVTTRIERAASMMGTLTTHHLQHLTEDDSWILFRKRAFKDGAEESQNLVSIGKDIVKKCGGLPLAVKTLGALMRSKSKEREWLSVKDSEIWGMQVGVDGILPALRLSYSRLPSHLKQCFAFCAIFPKDYVMEKEMLIQLWMANGFIPSDERKELQDIGNEIFNELAWRSFLQDIKEAGEDGIYTPWSIFYRKTTCKMHDLMHDLAQSIMGNECPVKWEDVSKKTRHLYIHVDFQSDIHMNMILNNSPNIRTLLKLHWSPTIIVTGDSLKPKSLRALELHDDIDKIRPLLNEIRFMKHLRYLDLSGTDITALPEATSTLLNLQTLKLSGCRRLRKLPDGMRNMSNLKHLYINGCPCLDHLPAGIGQLRNLRTLLKYIVGNDAESGIDQLNDLNLGGLLELCNLRNVRNAADAKGADLNSKHNLCSLILCWDMIPWNMYPDREEDVASVENAEEVLEALRPHIGLKLLIIFRYGGTSFPTWLMDSRLLQNLVEIHLEVCTGCEHLPPLWQSASLKFLYLKKMDKVKHICSSTIYGNESNGTVQAFLSLKRLKLQKMQSLEAWTEDEGTAGVKLVFPRLEELAIKDCPNLMTMPELPSLESLKMKGTDIQLGLVSSSLTTLSSLHIDIHEKSTGTAPPPLSQKKMSFKYFKSLENLTISAFEEDLALLLEEEETRGLSTSLHHLTVKKCNGLFSSSQQSSSPLGFWKNLTSLLSLDIRYSDDLLYWPEEEFRGLNSLEDLCIGGCKNLIGSSPSSLSSSSSGDGEFLPNLKHLNIGDCDGLLELPKLPASLRSLNVKGCPRLNSLTEGLRHAIALDSVDISKCESLTSLPEDMGHLTELTSLDINSLPCLESLPQGLRQLAALQFLWIGDCSKLSSLPEGMQGLIALRRLHIVDCPLLSSLPEGLQQRLPGLQDLRIGGCPNLERRCKKGGQYWYLVSKIPKCEITSERSTISSFLPSLRCFSKSSTV